MSRALLFLVFATCLIPPLQAAEQGVILLYHHVAEDTPPSTSLSPAEFRSHLEYLRDNNFEVIGLDTLVEGLRTGRQLPSKSVAITFDDGYSSIYAEAFPMLQAFGFPFTLFVNTGPINNQQQGYMSWDQIRDMSAAGVVVANHMIEHPYMLNSAAGISPQAHLDALKQELLQAEATILAETGQSHRYLAYPYGEFNSEIKALLAELDYVGFAQNSGAVGVNSDFLALPRYPLASIYANLDTASTKFATLAFNVKQLSPLSPVTTDRRPSVTLQFSPGPYNLSQIGCFANSQPLQMEWLDYDAGIVELKAVAEYQGRRWRYICTAPDPGSASYYWYSVQWIKLPD